jgi:hypothetical protein
MPGKGTPCTGRVLYPSPRTRGERKTRGGGSIPEPGLSLEKQATDLCQVEGKALQDIPIWLYFLIAGGSLPEGPLLSPPPAAENPGA